MKKNTITKNYTVSVMALFIMTAHAVKAQSYFAGSGAGAGNTGTLATGVGAFALGSSNSGTANAAFGSNALFKNTTGSNNGAFGANTLYNNTNGSFNVAVGKSALYYNIAGNRNVAVGYNSLYSNTTGAGNTATGFNSLHGNTTGYSNTAIGISSLQNNSSGSRNTAIGDSSMFLNTTASNNVSVGYNSLKNNLTGTANTAIGVYALENYTGTFATAVGAYALQLNNSYGNSAFGAYSLKVNTTGSNNTAAGRDALSQNTTGNGNAAFGESTLLNNSTGHENTAAGKSVLFNANGNYNTGIGFASLLYSTSNEHNTAVGWRAGSGEQIEGNENVIYTLGSQCSFLGARSNISASGISNSTAIGYNAKVDASNKVVIGNTAVTSIGGQVGWTTYSDQRLKTNINKSKLGLDFIKALNPVTYNYKAEGQKDILYTGLIAQEVDEAAKKAGMEFSAVDKNGGHWGIRYGELTVPLIKAVQEMEEKHSAEVEALQSRIEKLEQAVTMLIQKQNGGNISDKNSLLFQNQPNPADNGTTIRYMLQSGIEKASIIIRDVKGRALKQFDIKSPGNGSILLKAGELASGTYTYSLIVKGQAVDSKLMVITH